MSKIGYMGAGTWGTALASLLAKKGHEVTVWDINLELLELLDKKRRHPKLKDFKIPKEIVYKKDFEKVISEADVIVESVTSKGIRNTLEIIRDAGKKKSPVVITSKGLESKTGLLFPEIAFEVLKERERVVCLSGPSHAEEVVMELPTLVVSSSLERENMEAVAEVFRTKKFRVYPNGDILGVAFGGAMKNIIAIACAVSDGLGFGDNTRAALITRGLHELRKLAVLKGGKRETLNGLAGLGDLIVTCTSPLSRNYRFGKLLASGYNMADAIDEIGMAVEGVHTCVAAFELSRKNNVELPITEAIYKVLYENMSMKEAVESLLKRVTKEEHL